MIIASGILKKGTIKNSMFKESKNGIEFLPLTIKIFDTPDEYGNNVKIMLEQSKEERESGVEPVYFGSGKVVFTSAPKTESKGAAETSDDIFS
jgi:hypothetical protein